MGIVGNEVLGNYDILEDGNGLGKQGSSVGNDDAV